MAPSLLVSFRDQPQGFSNARTSRLPGLVVRDEEGLVGIGEGLVELVLPLPITRPGTELILVVQLFPSSRDKAPVIPFRLWLGLPKEVLGRRFCAADFRPRAAVE